MVFCCRGGGGGAVLSPARAPQLRRRVLQQPLQLQRRVLQQRPPQVLVQPQHQHQQQPRRPLRLVKTTKFSCS